MTKGERKSLRGRKVLKGETNLLKIEMDKSKLEHTNRGSKLMNHLLHLYVH